MGGIRRHRKKIETPGHPYDKVRLERELPLVGEYGLRNKRELWKARTILSTARKQARSLLALEPDVRSQREGELLSRLSRFGILHMGSDLDSVLALDVRTVLDRRLQTIVHKKGLASTPYQARQFITHRHIAIGDGIVTTPSRLITINEEDQIVYAPRSPLNEVKHPARPQAPPVVEEIEKKPEEKVERKEEKPKPAAKPREEKPKPAAKPREEKPKPAAKPREEKPKPAAKPREEKPKPAAKPKEEKPKPAAKPREEKPKPAAKPKEEKPKPAAKPKEEKPKPAAKHKEEKPKPAAKPKEEKPKPTAKPKEEKPKPAAKSKEEKPKPTAMPKAKPKEEDPKDKPAAKPKTTTAKTATTKKTGSTSGKKEESK